MIWNNEAWKGGSGIVEDDPPYQCQGAGGRRQSDGRMDVDGYKVSGHEVAAWEGSIVVVDSSLFDLVATGQWCTKPAGSVPSVVMYSMRRGLLDGPCICVMDCVLGAPRATRQPRNSI